MEGGYVALLDVLGFSALVATDQTGERIRGYLRSLGAATRDSRVEYVAFSDSIVLTVDGDDPESLAAIAATCSKLLCEFLNEGIPLRGAIAWGNFFRSSMAESVFVAGRAVIDAYQYEQAQKWVGIMLAPSALQQVPDLETRCRINANPTPWAAFVQPHASIPLDSGVFQGFAIVPTKGEAQPVAVWKSIDAAIERLKWLRTIAPSPSAQGKYNHTLQWLSNIRKGWYEVARTQEQTGSN